MKKSYMQDPFKFAVSGLFGLLLVIMIPEFIRQGEPLGAVIFGGIGLVFVAMAIRCSRLVEVSPEGVAVSFCGLFKKKYKWAEFREVGVCGMRIFKPFNSKSSGTMYIYFSKEYLEDTDRLEMLLNWPKKDVPYVIYTRKTLDHVQVAWGDREITFFNADQAKMYR